MRPGQRPTGGFEMPREQRETARIQYRPPRRWRGTVVVLFALLIAAAAAVNFYLIPLEVLIAWRNPAIVSVATDPNGASLRLDGVPLDRATPLTLSVQRDRADHLLEATRPGYQPAREIVRYDKSVGLAFLLRLERDPAAPPPASQTDTDAGAASGGVDGAAPSGPGSR